MGASIPPLSQIHPSGTSFFTQPESIRRSSPQPGVDLPQSRLCARVPGELHKERGGRPAIPVELQTLIARMAAENRLWGQKRIQAELARLGFQVSARTVAKYMRGCRRRGPIGTSREFLMRHASNMWACDFFCVPTTLHVFFVIRLANKESFHVAVTRHPPTRGAQTVAPFR